MASIYVFKYYVQEMYNIVVLYFLSLYNVTVVKRDDWFTILFHRRVV